MTTVPAGSKELHVAAEEHKRGLRQCVFDGDRQGFSDQLRNYLEHWGKEDLHASLLLNQAVFQTTSALTFQSFSTDRKELEKEAEKRWRMWLEVLPLDAQLTLVHLEMDMRNTKTIPFGLVDWGSMEAIEQSTDPEMAFRTSSIGGWIHASMPSPGSPKVSVATKDGVISQAKTWNQMRTAIQGRAQAVALSLMAWHEWDYLDSWMKDAKIHPWERMDAVYVHHVSPTSRGAWLAKLPEGLPFWSAGVYARAWAPEYWEIMARHGGPHHPDQSEIEETRLPGIQATLARQSKDVSISVPNLMDPLAPLKFEHEPARESIDQMMVTAAQWRGLALNQTLPTQATQAPGKRKRF